MWSLNKTKASHNLLIILIKCRIEKHLPHRECQTPHTFPLQSNPTCVFLNHHLPTKTFSQDWEKAHNIWIVGCMIPCKLNFKLSLLFSLFKVGLHHINKVFWGSVSIARHVNKSKCFSYCEEIKFFCVPLKKSQAIKWEKSHNAKCIWLGFFASLTITIYRLWIYNYNIKYLFVNK